jgi:hypothetical protein
MADKKDSLERASLADVVLNTRPLNVAIEFRDTLHMTPEAVDALVNVEQLRTQAVCAQASASVEVAKAQAAASVEVAKAQTSAIIVPASENSKRHYASWVGASAITGGAVVSAAYGWLTPALATVLIAVVGIFKVGEVAKDWIAKKKSSGE